ncbi:Autoimmune regulator [Trema orientale]|uniref:Autoimmune regulator n=1 Tax=Trema orientale TaxID=63057 RepID=A0A2P5G057_TREOI|nr:Autoimmune regulator [Trema orientale]
MAEMELSHNSGEETANSVDGVAIRSVQNVTILSSRLMVIPLAAITNPVCAVEMSCICQNPSEDLNLFTQYAFTPSISLMNCFECKSCNLETSTDDVEDWVYSQLENTTHLLHGVIHSNGYGHLLRVNGREGGSRILSGCHIMDFWDRLCKTLGARKVSVMDVSKKYGLEYRLLHSITKGHPWYGNWGYEFGPGSFALSVDAYKTAVESLSGLPLSIFLSQGQKPCSRLLDIISYYQSSSERKLVNVRDLFCFVLSLLHDVRKTSSRADDAACKKQHVGTSGIFCSWTRSDIERVEEAMLRVLRAVSGANWVSIRALKGAVFKVAPPQLLDYCLRDLGGKMTPDGMVVNARLNPDTGTFEYRLEARRVSSEGNTACTESSIFSRSSEESLLHDLRFLYECMLHPRTLINYMPQVTRDLAISSAEKLLDCKQFVKDYEPEKMFTNTNNSLTSFLCLVELVDEIDEIVTKPPPELVILSPNATVSAIKLEASKAFQDVYLMFKGFHADELLGYGGVDDSTQLKYLLGSPGVVRLRGRCHVKHGLSRFRMERGMERWTVECSCGAKDDDGERMLACDVCGVWQHTRCSGILDSELVPVKFICYRCKNSLSLGKTGAAPCKDEAVTNVGSNSCLGKSLTAPDVML